MNTPIPKKDRKKVIRTASLSWSLYAFLGGQLSFLNEHYEMMTIGSDDPELQNMARREGIISIPVNIERTISPFKDVVSIYKLYKIFKKEKPFMVHSMNPKAGLVSMIAAYFAGVPKRVHTFTGLIFPTKKGPMKQLLLAADKLICKFATHIYPEGNGVKNDLQNHNVTNKPLNVIANGNINGVNLDYFDPKLFTETDTINLREQLGIQPTDFVFVFLGRLVNDKGVNELVAAFDSLTREHSGAKLVLVGSHEGESDLLPQATWDRITSNKNIIEVGHQYDVRPYFAIASALVFPSYREGFPNVVLEAGAMGLPSIVTDINGSNEIIIPDYNGLIIPSKDTKALEQAMRWFLDNPTAVAALAKECRNHIKLKYDRKFVWEEVLKEYKHIEAEG